MLPKDIFKNHIHIGIDLDETLASTSSGMLEVAHDMGKLLHCSSTEDLSIHDIFDDPSFMVTEQEMLEIWQEYNIRTMSPLNVPPQEGAIQGIGSLFTAGKRCSIITARNGNNTIERIGTENWVNHYFPTIGTENIHFVNHYSNESLPKSQVCKSLGIALLIDDHINNAHDMIQAGFSMILLEKPWNRDVEFVHPLLHRVKGWKDIIDNLERKDA